MKSINSKLPAFTLMEVTIAMLITAIVIGITFTAYQIVTRSYTGFTKKQANITTLTTVDKLLKKDFLNAAAIVRAEDGLLFKINDGIIAYSFKEDYILRDQFTLYTDTFKMKVSNAIYLYENKPVETGELVDQFNFQTQVEKDNIPLHYLKTYSAQDLFK